MIWVNHPRMFARFEHHSFFWWNSGVGTCFFLPSAGKWFVLRFSSSSLVWNEGHFYSCLLSFIVFLMCLNVFYCVLYFLVLVFRWAHLYITSHLKNIFSSSRSLSLSHFVFIKHYVFVFKLNSACSQQSTEGSRSLVVCPSSVTRPATTVLIVEDVDHSCHNFSMDRTLLFFIVTQQPWPDGLSMKDLNLLQQCVGWLLGSFQ